MCIFLPAVVAYCQRASLSPLCCGMFMSLPLRSNKEQMPHNQSISLHPGQKLNPPHSAKPPLFGWSAARCSAAAGLAVAEERLSPDAPLPAFSPGPGSGTAVRKVGCRWFWGRILLLFCCVPSQDSGAFLPHKRGGGSLRWCLGSSPYAEGWWQI